MTCSEGTATLTPRHPQIKSELNILTLTLSAKVVEPEPQQADGQSQLSTPSMPTPPATQKAAFSLDPNQSLNDLLGFKNRGK